MTLPRRGALGLLLRARDQDTPGAPVRQVHPGGAAERAGLRADDLITALDAHPIDGPDALAAVRLHASAPVRVTLLRDGETHTLTLTPTARATEKHPSATVTYGEAPNGAVRLRTILCVPDGATRAPCVMYIPGYPCASVEDASPTPGAVGSLVRALLARGVAVFRCDKRGTGDSEGAPDPSLHDEHEDLAAGLARLLTDPAIDASRVTLFGHSLGGLHAPALAAEHPSVRGVAVYGGGVLTWREYLVALTRRRLALGDVDPAEQDDIVRETQRFQAYFFGQGIPLATILAEHPAFWTQDGVDSERTLYGRHEGFWREVEATNIPRALSQMSADLLALWGSADWLTFREEHVAMADMVNRWRPGHARFAPIVGADHAMRACDDLRASFENRGTTTLHEGLVETLAQWVKSLA